MRAVRFLTILLFSPPPVPLLCLFVIVFCLIPFPAATHVIIDPEVIQRILAEIDRDYRESREGINSEAKAEALYRLGERGQSITELLNQDLLAHGQSDLLAQFLIKRLEAYEIKIAFSEQEQRYVYDLSAFREYLNRAPTGKHTAEARFQIIARTFYETLGTDPSKIVKTDIAGLMNAVAEKERFLKEYPQHEKIKEVLFFLAVDYYRLLKNVQDPEKVKEYRRLSKEALERLVTGYPGTMEARAAETLLEGL